MPVYFAFCGVGGFFCGFLQGSGQGKAVIIVLLLVYVSPVYARAPYVGVLWGSLLLFLVLAFLGFVVRKAYPQKGDVEDLQPEAGD